MSDLQEPYLDTLRRLVGPMKLITPGVRAVVRDGAGRVLFIRRRDSGQWALPAGGLELDESLAGCLRRELFEETGLTAITAEVMAIYSDPRFSVVNTQGEAQQKLTVVFLVEQWAGTLLTETQESIDARFFAPENAPPLPPHHVETLDDLRGYNGTLILK